VGSLSGADATACGPDSVIPLGKHEELPIKERQRASESCTCGPAHLRLRSEHGELVKVRGKCVNKCSYCAKLAAVENCEMLMADALDGDRPTLIMILGTRTATLNMREFEAGRQAVVQKLRRRWPAFEYAYQVEFTTGYGPHSGGLRRPHWNWFCKGVPAGCEEEARGLAVPEWCRLVDAEPHAQYVDRIDNAVGLTKYVTQHFMKASQAPPAGFTGQRFNCSKGYFGSITRATARARAKDSLALGRELWKAAQRSSDAHEIELTAQLAHRRNVATRWVLASETGARLSAAAIPLRAPRERLALQRAIRDRRSARRLAQLVSPDWMPHRETLFSDRA
jgi:hypothetical protein